MAILAHLTNRLYHYGLLMRLNRPIGTLLLLWPTLMALWLASDGHPKPSLVFIFTAGVVVMRAAGCVVNDYADRDFDGHVKRTNARPLVAGTVSAKEAIILFLSLVVLAFVLVCFTNQETMWLSIGAVLLALMYPFMKRYTHFPQVVLGAAFGFAIPMAYSACEKPLVMDCWLLYAATLLWAVAYDTLYAMVDKEDDLNIGVKSTAIAFGRYDSLMVGICHISMLAFMVLLGYDSARGVCFFIGIAMALGFACYQQWLIRNRETSAFFQAFLNNQWLGFVLFAGTFSDFLI